MNLKESILGILLWSFSFLACSQTKEIKINYNADRGYLKNLTGVNLGPEDCSKGYEYAGITYIRLHDYKGPFDYWYYSDFYNIDSLQFNYNFDPYDSTQYNWGLSDVSIDSILALNIEPYFRLGISWPNTSTPIVPPKDQNDSTYYTFASLCKQTVKHYNFGWDNGYWANIKYWELWNEPGGVFWDGTPNEFYNMYREVCDSIKSLDSNLFVGGPGALPSAVKIHAVAYFDNFIAYCQQNNVSLDFYSWHLYGMINPYSLKDYADTVRYILDSLGFTHTESHVNEINQDTPADSIYQDSPLGAAFTTSLLFTAQESEVDKLMWYRGTIFNNLFYADTSSNPNLTWNAYGFKVMGELYQNTPVILETSGNETVIANHDIDTTNLMVLAGKQSNDSTSIYVAISNLNSNYNTIKTVINKHPWKNKNITVTQYAISDYHGKYIDTIYNLIADSEIIHYTYHAQSPSVFLIKLNYFKSTEINNRISAKSKLDVFPNPVKGVMTIKADAPISQFQIYNSLGINIYSKSYLFSKEYVINTHLITPGYYWLNASINGYSIIKKLCITK